MCKAAEIKLLDANPGDINAKHVLKAFMKLRRHASWQAKASSVRFESKEGPAPRPAAQQPAKPLAAKQTHASHTSVAPRGARPSSGGAPKATDGAAPVAVPLDASAPRGTPPQATQPAVDALTPKDGAYDEETEVEPTSTTCNVGKDKLAMRDVVGRRSTRLLAPAATAPLLSDGDPEQQLPQGCEEIGDKVEEPQVEDAIATPSSQRNILKFECKGKSQVAILRSGHN